MSTEQPVEAVRAGVGDFFLAAEEVHEGMRFSVADLVYEVASKPLIVGTGRWLAQVRKIDGPPGSFGAYLRNGKHVD